MQRHSNRELTSLERSLTAPAVMIGAGAVGWLFVFGAAVVWWLS